MIPTVIVTYEPKLSLVHEVISSPTLSFALLEHLKVYCMNECVYMSQELTLYVRIFTMIIIGV